MTEAPWSSFLDTYWRKCRSIESQERGQKQTWLSSPEWCYLSSMLMGHFCWKWNQRYLTASLRFHRLRRRSEECRLPPQWDGQCLCSSRTRTQLSPVGSQSAPELSCVYLKLNEMIQMKYTIVYQCKLFTDPKRQRMITWMQIVNSQAQNSELRMRIHLLFCVWPWD